MPCVYNDFNQSMKGAPIEKQWNTLRGMIKFFHFFELAYIKPKLERVSTNKNGANIFYRWKSSEIMKDFIRAPNTS